MGAIPVPDGNNVAETVRRLRILDAEIFGTLFAKAGTLGDLTVTGFLIGGGYKASSGTSETPAFTFTEHPRSGMYHLGLNQLAWTISGITRMQLNSTRLLLSSTSIYAKDGGVTTPPYSFDNDTDTGTYLVGTNQIGWTTGGTVRMQLNSTRLLLGTPSIYMKDGGVTTPPYSFGSTTNTGFYIYSGTQVGFAASGVVRIRMGTGNFYLESSVTDVRFRGINSFGTTGTTANMFAQTSGTTGQLQRVTSAKKYKSRINYSVDYLADIELRPTKHYRKDDKRWFYGFIADDLGEQDSLLGEYIDDEIENYDQRAVMAVMAAKINRLEKRLEELEK